MGKIAMWAALLSFSLLLLTVAIGAANFPGYSHAAQYISELGAHGAPHGRMVSWLGFVPSGLLLMVFAFAAPLALPRSAWAWLGFAALGYYAFGLVAGGIFPCDFGCRPEEPTASQVIHNAVAGTGYLTGITALLILGIQSRKWPGGRHLLPLGLACWVAAALSLPFLEPGFGYVGIAQRAIELSMGTWVIACALYLGRVTALRQDGTPVPGPPRGEV